MDRSLLIIIILFTGLLFGEEFLVLSGDIIQLDDQYNLDIRTCPDVVDSCLYVCSDASTNPCHPENLYSITIDTSTGSAETAGSRYRIYFPWEYDGMYAEKFVVTASWPCLSPTAVAATGNYAFWDIIGNGPCPGTVQGSIWYGDDCEDDDGNIGADHCLELVGRFCFAPGDTLNWPEESDQSISTDICDACWMSSAAWDDYDNGLYADPLLSPGPCTVFDHCHHSEPDSVLCGVGYLDGETVSVYEEIFPMEFKLYPSHPNPFNPYTHIRFSLQTDSYVSITIYDLMGRQIRSLVNQQISAGYHTALWNSINNLGSPVSAGVYIYSIQAGQFVQTRKMVLLK
jgi:hypothetical protein